MWSRPRFRPADSGRHPLDRLGLGAVPEFLPPRLVDEVIEECGCREVRRRALPARVTLYFVLALWFCPGAGYGEVLRVLFKQLRAQTGMGRWRIPTVSAAVQARCRLGRAPLESAVPPAVRDAPAAHLPGMTAFGRELALLKVSADGTRLDVADTPANRAAFGDPPGGRIGPGRYPQIRLLSLIACGTRALVDAAWSTVSVGEQLLLDKLVYRGNFHPGRACQVFGSVALSVVAGCADVSRLVMIDVTELVGIVFSGLSALVIEDVEDAGDVIVRAGEDPGRGGRLPRLRRGNVARARLSRADGGRRSRRRPPRPGEGAGAPDALPGPGLQGADVPRAGPRRPGALPAAHLAADGQVSAVARELAGRASARLLPALGIGVSRHTALRALLADPPPRPGSAPRAGD